MPDDLERWKADRKAALGAEDGWLNLVARIDLQQGRQTIGSAADNDVVLPSGPDHLGEILHDTGSSSIRTTDGVEYAFEMAPGGFPQARTAAFLFELHDAGDQTALRVRDLMIPREIKLNYFPFAPDWVVTARWAPLPQPENIAIGQKGGVDAEVQLTHEAVFDHQGRSVRLLPTHWKNGKPMFVLRDATSGIETYAASRFLIGEVQTDETILLDFNRAHNPPCAFTEFAICPLPPRENVLPFPIRAGELAI